MAGEHVLTLSQENFKTSVIESSGPVLVDFWAPWCSPCRMIAPVIDDLAAEYAGKAKVGKVNVDDNRDIAMEYGVMSIPTLILFKGGKAVERIVGFKPKSELGALIENHL